MTKSEVYQNDDYSDEDEPDIDLMEKPFKVSINRPDEEKNLNRYSNASDKIG